MTQICLMVGMYGSNSALFTQLHRLFGYRMHGTIDYHALSMKKSGYGEPAQVVSINEMVLAHNTSRWYEPLIATHLATWGADDSIHRKITAYIDTLSNDAIIEDPRISYTLPIWQHALTSAGHDITVVVPYHHPLTYANDMHINHHMSTRLALALWVAYTLAIEVHSRSLPRIFVAHDNIMRNWRQACGSIIELYAPSGLSAAHTMQIDAYMQMLTHSLRLQPDISTRIKDMEIAHIASDIYTALQQPTIDSNIMAALQQRFATELNHPQYMHDIDQYQEIYNDVFLDTETRIRMIHEHYNLELNELHAQQNAILNQLHSEHSNQLTMLYSEHSNQLTMLYDKHGKQIEYQSLMFAEALTKHEQQLHHMRDTYVQEIQYLNDKIATMQTEIDWRTDVAQQQQRTLDKLGWAIRILALKERIWRQP